MTVAAWTAACITVTFLVIKKTIGLRVNRHEEVVGLDVTEHGLQSSYADFIPTMHIETTASGKEKEGLRQEMEEAIRKEHPGAVFRDAPPAP